MGCTAVKVNQPEKGARRGSLQVHAGRSMRNKRVLNMCVAFIHARIKIRKGWDAQLSRRNSQKKERDADRSEYMQVGSMHGERLANTCVAFIHAQKGLWKGGMRSCQGAAKES